MFCLTFESILFRPLKLEEDGGATMFFIAEKQQKTILNFSLDSLIATE